MQHQCACLLCAAQADGVQEPAGWHVAVPVRNPVAAAGPGQRAAPAAALGTAAAPAIAAGRHFDTCRHLSIPLRLTGSPHKQSGQSPSLIGNPGKSFTLMLEQHLLPASSSAHAMSSPACAYPRDLTLGIDLATEMSDICGAGTVAVRSAPAARRSAGGRGAGRRPGTGALGRAACGLQRRVGGSSASRRRARGAAWSHDVLDRIPVAVSFATLRRPM